VLSSHSGDPFTNLTINLSDRTPKGPCGILAFLPDPTSLVRPVSLAVEYLHTSGPSLLVFSENKVLSMLAA
jgi:hypothetical protein